MLFRRDPRDRRYPLRLSASFVASLIIHALLAAFLFTVLVSSSEQGTTESIQGGEVITFQRTSPVAVANQPQVVKAAAPQPHVPVIAPLHHAPVAQPLAQQLPVNRHELAVTAPTAPPNPRPIPQQTPQPNPQPTQNIVETQPSQEIPAAPINIPTALPVAVAIKAPPTAAPSPAPSSVASSRPSPRPPAPTAQPSARPATPAPASPNASPTAAAIARATLAPTLGVPHPNPTSTATSAKTIGPAPKPGPSGGASPGPRQGTGPKAQTAVARPIAIPATPAPRVRATSAPKKGTPINLNARLRALLPHNPVNPTSKQYVPNYSLRGRLEPTPPPEVLAKTKYIYEVRGTGNEARVKMWVTAARKEGPTTICTGWLVRYPQAERGGYADVPSSVHIGPANGTQISIGGGSAAHEPLSPFAAGLAPIVDGMVSQACDGRLLAPYVPSAGSSP